MSGSLLIVGCGGFGREVYSIVQALNAAGDDWVVEGFVDDGPSPLDLQAVAAFGSRVISTIDELVAQDYTGHAVVAIGSARSRRSIAGRLDRAGVTYPVLIHPHVTIGMGVAIEPGTVIAAGARLSTNIAVGRHVHVDQNATVGHDCVLREFSRINPQGCISGSVDLGSGALIGANATVLQGLTIGRDAIIGAGGVVVTNVPPATTVKGVPAR